jgi:hypothetical protein
VARANCTPQCPFYDYQGQFYGETDPSYETVLSLSGGIGGGTRYFFSGLQREEQGIAENTGAKRQSLRANLDQALRDQINVSVSSAVLHSSGNRGLSNNDNSFSSPIYGSLPPPSSICARKMSRGCRAESLPIRLPGQCESVPDVRPRAQ